jgi:hypothetical protein
MDRHSYPYASGPGVAELIQRAVDHGDPIRLAWPHPHAPAPNTDEYPTAELPVIPPYAARAHAGRSNRQNSELSNRATG